MQADASFRGHIARFGLNYKFNTTSIYSADDADKLWLGGTSASGGDYPQHVAGKGVGAGH